MELVVAIGGGLFLLICVVGGARLLLLARRTRQLPELVLGLGLFFMGGIGMPLAALARAPLDLSNDTRELLMASQGLILALGYGAFTRFTQRVFRPQQRFAAVAAGVLPATVVVGVVVMVLEPDGATSALGHSGYGLSVGYLVQQLGGVATLSWTAVEALRHAEALRRRVRVRLADAVVANRVQLWGGAMALAAAMAALTSGAQTLGVDLMSTVGGMGVIACLGAVSAGGICLAFLPPHFSTAWLLRREAEA